jgi:hypothetical protein
LGEDEEEEMLLDRGEEYRMISIMRQKRPAVSLEGATEEKKMALPII